MGSLISSIFFFFLIFKLLIFILFFHFLQVVEDATKTLTYAYIVSNILSPVVREDYRYKTSQSVENYTKLLSEKVNSFLLDYCDLQK